MDLSKIIVPEGLVPTPIVTCVIEGHLEEEDLQELALSQPIEAVEGDDPADLKKLREKHHSVARMIAGGLNQRMVSQIVGYSESYLSVLLNNPAMQELVSIYRLQHGAAQQMVIERLATVGLKAIEEIDARLENDDKRAAMNINELKEVAKLGLDRGGHGPSSTVHSVNENIDYAELARLNKEARNRSASRIVPSAEVRKALAPPVEQQDESSGNVDTEATGLAEDREQQGLPEHRE